MQSVTSTTQNNLPKIDPSTTAETEAETKEKVTPPVSQIVPVSANSLVIKGNPNSSSSPILGLFPMFEKIIKRKKESTSWLESLEGDKGGVYAGRVVIDIQSRDSSEVMDMCDGFPPPKYCVEDKQLFMKALKSVAALVIELDLLPLQQYNKLVVDAKYTEKRGETGAHQDAIHLPQTRWLASNNGPSKQPGKVSDSLLIFCYGAKENAGEGKSHATAKSHALSTLVYDLKGRQPEKPQDKIYHHIKIPKGSKYTIDRYVFFGSFFPQLNDGIHMQKWYDLKEDSAEKVVCILPTVTPESDLLVVNNDRCLHAFPKMETTERQMGAEFAKRHYNEDGSCRNINPLIRFIVTAIKSKKGKVSGSS
ncbi:MAG: hypothetical protein S4CHLAM27_02180 [Chlamydiia bacterium]|nr:hypothetical protein [Chlamydiia bacterium]